MSTARFMRAVRDLIQVKLSLTAVFVAMSVASFLALMTLEGGLENAKMGYLSASQPIKPVSFLRALDPDDKITRNQGSKFGESILDQPGMSILVSALREDDRLMIAIDSETLSGNMEFFPELLKDVLVVVGEAPYFLPEAVKARDDSWVLGDLSAGEKVRSDVHFGPVQLEEIDATVPDIHFVAGNGAVYNTADYSAVVRLTVDDMEKVGIVNNTAADFSKAVTCRCEPLELKELAQEMNSAEIEADTSRRFYAVRYSDLVTPADRSFTAQNVLLIFVSGAALLSALGAVSWALARLWRMKARGFAVERVLGASEIFLQLRQQMLTFMTLAGPILAAFVLPELLMIILTGENFWENPRLGEMVPLVALGAQCAVGFSQVLRVRRLCQDPTAATTAP